MTELREQYKSSTNLEARIHLQERFSTNPYGMLRWLFDQMALPAQARILELGCGIGNLWTENADRLSPDWALTLTDFSPGMLAQNRRNTAALVCRPRYGVVNAMDVPFTSGQFEVVIANHMLYYMPDLPRALAGIRRVLRPGGRLFASTNGLNHMRELVDLVHAFDPALPFMTHVVRNFSLDDGPARVAEYFSDVAVRRRPDGLRVTDAEALSNYILSSSAVLSLPTERKAALRAFVQQRLSEMDGTMRIQKDTGLIGARRAG